MSRVLIIFAAMSPLGIFAGWALDALTTGLLQDVVSAGRLPAAAPPIARVTCVAGLTALASGTFVYVSLVDVLMEEFGTPVDKGPKFACLVGGFVAMAAILHVTHVGTEALA